MRFSALARLWLLCAVMVLLTSCGEKRVYGILVVVRARGAYVIPNNQFEADEIRIQVFGKRGDVPNQGWVQTALYSEPIDPGRFPFPYGLVPRGGDTQRLYMTVVTLLHEGRPLEEKVAIGTFPQMAPDRVLYFDFVAESECFQHLCRVGDELIRTEPCANQRTECVQHCVDGACVEVNETDGDDLDPLGEDWMRGLDGGMNPDGGDGGTRDGDAGQDGEAGSDADADAVAPECTEFDDCDDGDRCTDDACDTDTRTCSFVAKDCGASTECMVRACNPVSGMCETLSRMDDSPCASGICCAGACVDDEDVAHCGTCANRCGVNQTCEPGTPPTCQCEDAYGNCDGMPGCETRIANDPLHCGRCMNPCPGGQACLGFDGTDPTSAACRACSGMTDCNDGLPCTNDSCMAGECSNLPNATSCLIDGSCHAMGEVATTMPCAQCNPANSGTMWSPNPGASCASFDTDYCTVSEMCGAAVGQCDASMRDCAGGGPAPCTVTACDEATDSCGSSIMTGTCAIESTCFADGALRPTNACQACTAMTSQTAWTARTGSTCDDGLYCTNPDSCTAAGTCSGTPRNCDDGKACTTDTCDEMAATCFHPLQAGNCLIADTCYANGVPEGPSGDLRCHICNPAVSMSGWSFASVGTNCGGTMTCNAMGMCTDGGGT